MLDAAYQRRIDTVCDILVGKVFGQELMERMEGKIRVAIGRVWGRDTTCHRGTRNHGTNSIHNVQLLTRKECA